MSDTAKKGKPFRMPTKTAAEWVPTKYDSFKLVMSGDYKHQKGSGRSACFELAKHDMLIGTWTKKCAEYGFAPKFALGCLIKLRNADKPGWSFSKTNAEGKSYMEVLAQRSAGSKDKGKPGGKKAPKSEKKRVRTRVKKPKLEAPADAGAATDAV
jgi:hypothetical protein